MRAEKKERKLYRLISDLEDKDLSQLPTVKEELLAFSDVTSVHGIPHATRAKGPIKKTFWVVLGILGFLALIGHIFLITQLFLSYHVSVSISLEHEPELAFPAVTLCNMSPVRRSRWNAALASGALFRRGKNATVPRERKRRKRSVSCPAGWMSSSWGTCYLVSTTLQRYHQAARTCQATSPGATLVTIHSQAEQTFIEGIIDGSEDYWLGLKKSGGVWAWSDGVVGYSNYDNWDSQYPLPSSACAYIGRGSLWKNAACDGYFRYVCELENYSANVTSQPVTTTVAYDDVVAAPVTYLIEPTNETCDCPCCNAASELYQITVTPEVSDPLEEETPAVREDSAYPDRLALREDFIQGEEVLELLADAGEEQARQLGYTIQDMILDCQYAGSTCSFSRDFVEFYNPVHGNCFTFNSGWNDNVTTSKRTGKRHGLELTMNIDQEDYMPELSDTAGVRIVVHPHNRMPFPEDEGITLSPGMLTYIGVRQVEINRLSGVYGNCRQTKDANLDSNVYEEYFNVEYSLMACLKTCHQRHTISRCGCADAYFPSRGSAFGDEAVSICTVTNITQDDCMFTVQKLFEQNELECDCPNPCSDLLYETRSSYGQWPSDTLKAAVLSQFASKVPQLMNDTSDPTKYSRNLLKANVYFEEFNYEYIEEEIDYPPSQYASDLGGVLGLWFGVSLFTVAEFAELITDFCVLAYRKKKDKSSSKDKGKKGKGKIAPVPRRLTPLQNGQKSQKVEEKTPDLKRKTEQPEGKHKMNVIDEGKDESGVKFTEVKKI